MKWRPENADLAYPESVPRNHIYEQHAGEGVAELRL